MTHQEIVDALAQLPMRRQRLVTAADNEIANETSRLRDECERLGHVQTSKTPLSCRTCVICGRKSMPENEE